MCKKQGAVSHSSTEAEVISLEACMRMEGIPCMTLLEVIIETFNPDNTIKKNVFTQDTVPKPTCDNDILMQCDFVPPTINFNGRAKMLVLEDNEAVIQMCIKGRSPNMRHILRTHRVDLDWMFERFLLDPALGMKYVNTKQQIGDILTKGSFSEKTWKDLLYLLQIGPSNHKH